MKKKIEIAVLIAVILSGLYILIFQSGTAPGEESAGSISNLPHGKNQITTIRNVTEERIAYKIGPADSTDSLEERVIDVGSVDLIPASGILDISFKRAGRSATYELSPGKPYSFRYDEYNLLQIYEGAHGRVDAVDLAPYVPTPMIVVEQMLTMVEINQNDLLYDIGCGDGRIVVAAVKYYGARGVGIDIDPERIQESREKAAREGVSKRTLFIEGDATKMDYSQATVVTLYLLPESNAILRPILEKHLRPGTPVLSHNYSIPGWENREIKVETVTDVNGEPHSIFLYRR